PKLLKYEWLIHGLTSVFRLPGFRYLPGPIGNRRVFGAFRWQGPLFLLLLPDVCWPPPPFRRDRLLHHKVLFPLNRPSCSSPVGRPYPVPVRPYSYRYVENTFSIVRNERRTAHSHYSKRNTPLGGFFYFLPLKPSRHFFHLWGGRVKGHW